MSGTIPMRRAPNPEVEARLRSMAMLLSSLAEDAAEQGMEQLFLLLRDARRALVLEARQYYGLEL